MEKKLDNLAILRHSCAHIMAQAVKQLYPEVKLGIGPAIENGFYYDFDKKDGFTSQDLEKITQKMEEIIKKDIHFEKIIVSKEEAKKMFQEINEDYKLEILDEINEEEVSIYKQDGFFDLCRGPHLESTGKVKYFKLLSISGAYWKGKENNPMLQRIYGTAFFTKEELEDYLNFLEEVKKRDHRKLGAELGLFGIEDEAGAGLVYWYPKGAIIRNIIEKLLIEKHLKNGYQLVYTPHLAKIDLWQTSGHLDFYKEYMYPPLELENQKYVVKPMNCPAHILIYKKNVHSYKELPIKFTELGTVYRYEKSGVLHGLLRVRGFTQDDAHIFCRFDQLAQELKQVLSLAFEILKIFGFSKYEVYLSTRPEKYVGTVEDWEKATNALIESLNFFNIDYQVDPGEGVFYGPKVDIKIKDSLGRAWQCSTIQVDFNLPQKFGIYYINSQGEKVPVVMIHRALVGSLERFFGVLIEHYGGEFPFWLSPLQIKILPITDKQLKYAKEIEKKLNEEHLRVEIDNHNATLSKKIFSAQQEKVPYMLIIGENEENNSTVNVRERKKGNLGSFTMENFIQLVKKEENLL